MQVTILRRSCYFPTGKVAKNRPEKLVEFPLDHIAIAVPDIRAALPLFELVSGGTGSPLERVESQKVEVAFVGTGAGRIELLQPTSPDSAIQRFLESRGSGLHHIAYRVPDVDEALRRFAQEGIRLIDEKGRPGAGGHRVAFLHPRSTHGVLIELVEG